MESEKKREDEVKPEGQAPAKAPEPEVPATTVTKEPEPAPRPSVTSPMAPSAMDKPVASIIDPVLPAEPEAEPVKAQPIDPSSERGELLRFTRSEPNINPHQEWL